MAILLFSLVLTQGAGVSGLLAEAAAQAPRRTVPVAVFAVPFKDDPSAAAVVVYVAIPGTHFSGWTQPGVMRRLDLRVTLRNASGVVESEKQHTVNTAFGQESLASLRAMGLRLITQLPATAAGAHVLAVSVTDVQGGVAGEVSSALDVPDFSIAPLTISGLALYAWPQRPQSLTVVTQIPMAGVLPWAPIIEPELGQAETLALFGEVYDAAPAGAPRAIDVSSTLRAADGRVVVQTRSEGVSDAVRGRRNEYGFQAQLPLTGVAPGSYTLQVEAQSSDGIRASREMPVQVR